MELSDNNAQHPSPMQLPLTQTDNSHAGIPPDAVRVQLEKVLASPGFAHSHRLNRFLRFIVERALAGQGGDFKEYTLGVEVFDRGPSFDPRVDPIVRVEAGRLRAKLRQYYKTKGRGDPLLVSFFKGGYSPIFRRRSSRPPKSRTPPALMLSLGDWKADLSSAISTACSRRQPVSVASAIATQARNLDVEVVPVLDDAGKSVGATVAIRGASFQSASPDELRRSKAELDSLFQALQAANDELASNLAELQSTVEQLRKTNGELWALNEQAQMKEIRLLTDKEHLSSANEKPRPYTEE